MFLITEQNWECKYIAEARADGKKDFYIEGIFLQGDIKNRNGRLYPKDILINACNKYRDAYINDNRAYGELGHPEGPTINPERISHRIVELREDGSNFIGKAKISNTPYGDIARNLIEDGGKLGVSSRGMGTLKQKGDAKVVSDDFMLATAADIVTDPSAPGAFVEGIMEGKEWIWDNGILKEVEIARYKNLMENAKRDKEKVFVACFRDFLSKL